MAGGEPDIVGPYWSNAGASPGSAHFRIRAADLSNALRTPEIIEQRHTHHRARQKGQRGRSSPARTLSQGGYGTDAHEGYRVVLLVKFDA